MAKPKKIELIETAQLDSWLGSTGFLFPSNELELDRFNKLYEDYDYKLDDKSINPIAVINNTFYRKPKVITMFEEDVVEEIETLRMVARKGKKELPQHIIDKMRKKHNQDSSDSE
ncbi:MULTISPECIES: hypothetical protein [Flavobacteriaceae]|uniref:Uncharacterized protein n=2 Tax=Pseudomonadati TaxID=3379134 RepID=A0A9X4IL61_9FLAO|nr:MULTISPECIES: hypothetical protein [Flavobacteriaceae]MDE1206259.1 hypothetical protein [Tenacibaculum larymnensis]MDS1297062.1 hypothetical protein [Aequorivita sp. S2608]TXK74053.1 hypothetical protein FT986_11740 [Mesonia sp. K4-1]HIC32990.1 hypothetical protein [Flavobacteriaceae bacterium]